VVRPCLPGFVNALDFAQAYYKAQGFVHSRVSCEAACCGMVLLYRLLDGGAIAGLTADG
jgi:hypothetical protein